MCFKSLTWKSFFLKARGPHGAPASPGDAQQSAGAAGPGSSTSLLLSHPLSGKQPAPPQARVGPEKGQA